MQELADARALARRRPDDGVERRPFSDLEHVFESMRESPPARARP